MKIINLKLTLLFSFLLSFYCCFSDDVKTIGDITYGRIGSFDEESYVVTDVGTNEINRLDKRIDNISVSTQSIERVENKIDAEITRATQNENRIENTTTNLINTETQRAISAEEDIKNNYFKNEDPTGVKKISFVDGYITGGTDHLHIFGRDFITFETRYNESILEPDGSDIATKNISESITRSIVTKEYVDQLGFSDELNKKRDLTNMTVIVESLGAWSGSAIEVAKTKYTNLTFIVFNESENEWYVGVTSTSPEEDIGFLCKNENYDAFVSEKEVLSTMTGYFRLYDETEISSSSGPVIRPIVTNTTTLATTSQLTSATNGFVYSENNMGYGTIGKLFGFGSGVLTPVYGVDYANSANSAIKAGKSDYSECLGSNEMPRYKRLTFKNNDIGDYTLIGEFFDSNYQSTIKTNAWIDDVEAMVNYTLTNITTSTISLDCGHIGSYTFSDSDNSATNLTVTLNFTSNEKLGADAMLFVSNPTTNNCTISLLPAEQLYLSSEETPLTLLKSTTNLVSFIKVKSNVIIVKKEEVK